MVLFVFVGIFFAIRYGDRGRTERLEKCIEEKRLLMEEGLKEIGMHLGEPEIWLAHPEAEEFATFPIEGDRSGEPKRYYRVHSGAAPNGALFCRAGLIDSAKTE